MISKVICLIFDGLGDSPIESLGWKTPLEAANIPNFDEIAQNSLCGLMNALGRGIRPGSDVAHLALFGYPMEKYYTGRGPIEIAGLGIKLEEGDLSLRGNFATVNSNWDIIDRRAGRILEVSELAKALDNMYIDGINFIVKPGTAHRAGVILRGQGLSSAISDSDPHEDKKPVKLFYPLDSSEEAQFTSQVLNKFIQKAHEILKDLDINKKREKQGLLPANFLLLRGAGLQPSIPSFYNRYQLKACCIAGGGLYKGIGSFLGMDLIEVEGATALANTNINGKFKAAIKALDEYDFVFVHIKATDSLAEDGNYQGKISFLERVDKELVIFKDLPSNVLLVITSDHSTSCNLKAHTADPVPIIFYGKGIRVDRVSQFDERSCAYGGLGYIEGKDLMPQILNIMGKQPLHGA